MRGTPNRVLAVNDNWLQSFDRDGRVMATARRKNPGTLWHVFLREHVSGRPTNRAVTPHARVSGKLPDKVQQRLLRAILESA